MKGSRIVGRVLKSPTPQQVIAYSDTPTATGSYVYAEYEISGLRRSVVGVVSNSSYEPIVEIPAMDVLRREPQGYPVPGKSTIEIYVIADLASGSPESPRYPVPPQTPVVEAPPQVLKKLYPQPGLGFIKIGHLADHADIDIGLRVDEMAKHFLIAGATGSGKSNTVAVIADRLSAIGAPVVIFDVHGEYAGLETEEGGRVSTYEAKINPLETPHSILARMIVSEPSATRQRRLLRLALKSLEKDLAARMREGLGVRRAVEELYTSSRSRGKGLEPLPGGERLEDFQEERPASHEEMLRELLVQKIERLEGEVFYKKAVSTVVDKVEEFFESSPVSLDAVSIVDQIEPGRILVVDVSSISDEGKAWLLKLYSDQILDHVKQRSLGNRPFPTVLIVEEAPLFLSQDSISPAKESLRRLAREGRKFGAVLGIVSQRPRSLDVNVVSQLQNFVFLKMVQKDDIKAVMNIADAMDEDLARIIPSLPKGRAVVMGEWAGRFPVLVDIDMHRGKKRGATPSLAAVWRGLVDVARAGAVEDERFDTNI